MGLAIPSLIVECIDMKISVIREIDSISALMRQGAQLNYAVVQGVDFRNFALEWSELKCEGAAFLGCSFPDQIGPEFLMGKGALVMPKIPDLPYNPYRSGLYSRAELMEGWTPVEDLSVDREIYDHFVAKGRHKTDVLESLGQRMHDHAVDDALQDLLEGRVENDGKKKVVGIMGGHGTPRTDPYFKKVVRLARDLTKKGYYVASGGGPGIMEAANMGAWLADVTDDELEAVFAILAQAPTYKDAGYMEMAQKVLTLHPNGHSSLAVPTWFYGHEPTNLFSVRIAKYFSNSIREDGLLAIATHGVIFAPGSAGTTQEIFMDATQNHYVTFDVVSPMIFLGTERYQSETMIYPCLTDLAKGRYFADYIHCTDSIEGAVEFLVNHPPKSV